MGQDEHQHSQAGVLHASHGRAEHLPVGVELSQEMEMGQAEHQHNRAGAYYVIRGRAEQKSEGKPEQRCRDDTSCSSSMITQSVRQSPTTQGAVARYVGVPIGS